MMSQVQIESPKQQRRRRQERHLKRHPKFPARRRGTFTPQSDSKPKAPARKPVAAPPRVAPQQRIDPPRVVKTVPVAPQPAEPVDVFADVLTELTVGDEATPLLEHDIPTSVTLEEVKLATVLASPIEELDLGVRSFNVLVREGINTIGQLVERTADELLELRGLGVRSVDMDIRPKLAKLDPPLALKGEEPPQPRTNQALENDLSLPIEELDFAVRVYDALKREGINTVDDLVQLTRQDVLDIRDVADKALSEIGIKLAGLGLALKQDPAV